MRGAGGAVVAYSRATSPAVSAEEVAAQQLPWPGYLSRRAKKSMLAAYEKHGGGTLAVRASAVKESCAEADAYAPRAARRAL
jgi:hypothetical protein